MLPYGDETYGRGAADDEIWDDLVSAIHRADAVLVPGYPLWLRDHRFVMRLVLERRHQLSARLVFYAEQPYGAWSGGTSQPSQQDRRAKRRTVMRYSSQLPALGVQPMLGAWLHEVVHGGEAVAWL